MEGLEIKEVSIIKPIKSDNLRLESEFYTAKSFKLNKSYSGKEIIEFVQYGTSKELNEDFEGYPVLRLNEFQSFFIGTPSKYCKKIDDEIYNSLKLRKDDVLICRTNGNPKLVGKSALVPKDYDYAYASYLFKIRPKKELINASTLVAFLNSKYGRIEVEKLSMVSNQVNFSPAKFKEIRIPNFGYSLNQLVEKVFYTAYSLFENFQIEYSQAETLLLEILGLQHFKPSKEPVNVKSLKESFLTSGRLDAEYYQKKYEQIVAKIKTQNFARLGDIVKIKKSIEPGSDAYSEEGLPFLRVADYNKFGISKPQKCLSESFYKENFKKLSALKLKKGTILFSKDGSVGNAFVVKQDMNMVSSGAILHLLIKNKEQILPEYLTLVLNSQLVQLQAERDAGGSIILHWRVNEIEDAIVPIIDVEKQQQISNLIEESFRLKKQSEQLLEVAKTAVEKAIEENEEAAMEFINITLEEMNVIIR